MENDRCLGDLIHVVTAVANTCRVREYIIVLVNRPALLYGNVFRRRNRDKTRTLSRYEAKRFRVSSSSHQVIKTASPNRHRER